MLSNLYSICTFCIMIQLVKRFSILESENKLKYRVKFFIHEARWSNQEQVENLVILDWMTVSVFVAIN
jgi:hypothetical protein